MANDAVPSDIPSASRIGVSMNAGVGRGRFGERGGALEEREEMEVQSVRTGSDFFAGIGSSSISTYTVGAASAADLSMTRSPDLILESTPPRPAQYAHRQGGRSRSRRREEKGKRDEHDESSSDSDGTQIAGSGGRAGKGRALGNTVATAPVPPKPKIVDEVGGQDAFVAGMIYALSRRMLPGEPYTPSAVASNASDNVQTGGWEPESERGDRWKWRLEECLRSVLLCLYLSVGYIPTIYVDIIDLQQSSLAGRRGGKVGMVWLRRWLVLGGLIDAVNMVKYGLSHLEF